MFTYPVSLVRPLKRCGPSGGTTEISFHPLQNGFGFLKGRRMEWVLLRKRLPPLFTICRSSWHDKRLQRKGLERVHERAIPVDLGGSTRGSSAGGSTLLSGPSRHFYSAAEAECDFVFGVASFITQYKDIKSLVSGVDVANVPPIFSSFAPCVSFHASRVRAIRSCSEAHNDAAPRDPEMNLSKVEWVHLHSVNLPEPGLAANRFSPRIR